MKKKPEKMKAKNRINLCFTDSEVVWLKREAAIASKTWQKRTSIGQYLRAAILFGMKMEYDSNRVDDMPTAIKFAGHHAKTRPLDSKKVAIKSLKIKK